MTFVALIRDASVNLATDQLVLRAEEVQALTHAVDIGQRLARLLAESEQRLAVVRQVACDEGHAAGKEAGLLAARDEVATELTAMASAAHHQRLALQGSVTRLAIQVVRKLAGEVGASEMVAGLAQTAAADLLSGVSLTLRVHPSVVDAVRVRMDIYAATRAAHPGRLLHVEIRADAVLDPFDCILDTALGTTIAGLEDQLKRLETVLDGKSRTVTPVPIAEGGGEDGGKDDEKPSESRLKATKSKREVE